MSPAKLKVPIRVGVVGYGTVSRDGVRVGEAMGKSHAGELRKNPEFELVAICDKDPACLDAAREEFPGVALYDDLDKLLAARPPDLLFVVTPPNSHAALTIGCLEAGAHVVVDKPMCITVAEADAMIAKAKAVGRMLSVCQNRRWHGDFMAIQEVIAKGLLGEVFHAETGMRYSHGLGTWRSDKAVSGGAFYDWGAHLMDWVLHLVPGKVVGVNGYFQKRLWPEVTNEDHVHAVLHFSSGGVADVQISHLAQADRPRWRILGTKGAILDDRSVEGGFKVMTQVDGYPAEIKVRNKQRTPEVYYQNIADHLLRGAPLAVTPESGRRVIAVMETAERSAKSGHTESVPHE